jgi:hypothetical protein
MKNIAFYMAIFLLLFGEAKIIAQGNDLNSYTEEMKFIHSASEFSGIELHNSHGNITVTASENDSIEVIVVISSEAENQDLASEVFKAINIREGKANNLYYLRTSFGEEFYSRHRFSVNYEIHMPAGQELKLFNKFGDILISSITGPLEIEMNYGILKHESMTKTVSLKAKLSFAEVTLSKYQKVSLNLYNTKVSFEEVENGNFDAKYSQIEIPKAGKIDFKTTTSRLNIGTVKEAELKGDFCFTSIQKIGLKGHIEINKGLLVLAGVADPLQELSVFNNNAPINISLPESLSYTLQGEVTNGQFRHYRANQFRTIKDLDKISFSGSNLPGQNEALVVLFNSNAGINIEKQQ